MLAPGLPDLLDGARVLYWTCTYRPLFVASENVHGLVVCEDESSGAIYRFACSEGWRVLARERYPYIDDALCGSSPEFEIAEIRWTAAFTHPRDEVLRMVDELPEGGELPGILPVVEHVFAERSLSPREVAGALKACADTIWHAYEEPIPPDALRPRLVQRVRELLSLCDEGVIYGTLFTVATLRLVELIPDLERIAADARHSAELRAELGKVVSLLRTDPDPYSSLRQFERPK